MRVNYAIDILSVTGEVSGVISTTRRETPYVRRRYPSQAPTPAQELVRDNFRVVDLAWQHLTPELKQAWRDYQSWRRNFGYNRFQKVNIPLGLGGLPFILDPANVDPPAGG